MKCLSCGADVPGDATTCAYCNSSVPSSNDRGREATFARLKSSDELARSNTPERLARLPKVGAVHKAFLYVFFAIFIGGAAMMSLFALGAAGVIGIFGGRMGGGGAAFSIAPLLFAIVPLGFVAVGIFMVIHFVCFPRLPEVHSR